MQAQASLCVPHLRRVVAAGGYNALAIRRECGYLYLAGVTGKHAHLLSYAHVQQVHRANKGSNQQTFAVGRKRNCKDSAEILGVSPEGLPRLRVPERHDTVWAPGRNGLAVG